MHIVSKRQSVEHIAEVRHWVGASSKYFASYVVTSVPSEASLLRTQALDATYKWQSKRLGIDHQKTFT